MLQCAMANSNWTKLQHLKAYTAPSRGPEPFVQASYYAASFMDGINCDSDCANIAGRHQDLMEAYDFQFEPDEKGMAILADAEQIILNNSRAAKTSMNEQNFTRMLAEDLYFNGAGAEILQKGSA